MRVAIVFFGLPRSVPITIESIRRNIYSCNADSEIKLFTIASVNVVKKIRNPRTRERNVRINNPDIFLLNANYYILQMQYDFVIKNALKIIKLRGDYFSNSWISVRNSLHQLISLHNATELISESFLGNFEYFLFARPDLIYLDEIRFAELVSRFQGDGNIALPRWHGWGGLNDRVAFADATAARHYLGRLNLVQEYCAERQFHPESLLAYALAKGGCKVCDLPVRARRVRAHGEIADENFTDAVVDLPSAPRRFSFGPDGVRILRF
jgi:hypothetical protein